MGRTKSKTFTLTQLAADEIERQPVQIEYIEQIIDRFMLSGRTFTDLMYVERGPRDTLRIKTFNMREAMVEYLNGLGKRKASYFLDSLVHEQLASEGKLANTDPKKRTLKEIRTITGLGQQEFATKLGINPLTISKIECGVLPLSHKQATKIAEMFPFSLDEIEHSRKSGQKQGILRLLRLMNNMTQRGLAEAAGLKQEEISALENGKINISEKNAQRFALALDCNPDFFFSEDAQIIDEFILYFEKRGNVKSNPYFEKAMAIVQAQAGVKQMTPIEFVAKINEITDGLSCHTKTASKG